MNTNFVFPRPQPSALRPRPAQAAKLSSSLSSPNLAGSRDSNALRASILDVALELGIGSNPLVTDWMFNNALQEEDEVSFFPSSSIAVVLHVNSLLLLFYQEPVPSPGLTYGSPTSEESMLSLSSSLLHPKYHRDPHGVNFNLNQDVNKLRPLLVQQGHAGIVGLGDTDSQYSNADEAASNASFRNFQTIGVNDTSIASSNIIDPKRPSVRKLRKKFPGRDGYESDGGYISEKKAKKKEIFGDGMDVKQQDRKKKKNFIQIINKISSDLPTKGYESDGDVSLALSESKKGKTKKSKTKNPSKDIGYETDGGYQSSVKKSKTRFFKLKSSKSDLHAAPSGSVPALPKSGEKIVPLPIAGKFATTLSYLLSNPTTEGGGSHVDHTFPELAHAFGFTSTPSLPVGPSTFNRPVTSISGSPSAFHPNVTQLHPKNRDSHLSGISSSSSGSSNQHRKPQKSNTLFSQLRSPPSSKQGLPKRQHLRTASSLSSLQDPKSLISLPIKRTTSPTSADIPSPPQSIYSLPSSPTSPLGTSFSSLQSTKPLRVKLRSEHPTQQRSDSRPFGPNVLLPPTIPILQIPPRPVKVRPRNPPTDGFGPRSSLTSDSTPSTPGPILSPVPSRGFPPGTCSNGLSPSSCPNGNSRRSSQVTITPSTDYIVPSPPTSPSKTQTPEVPPTVSAVYYHHDHIPPQPTPAPRTPLPTLPSREIPARTNSDGSARQLPSVAHLRQRMAKMNKRQSEDDYGVGSSPQRGRELFLPSRPLASSAMAARSVSVGGAGRETGVGLRQYRDSYALEKNGIGPSTDDNHGRRSWTNIDTDISMDDGEKLEDEDEEVEEPDEFHEILGRFEICDDENGDIPDLSSGGQALERSHSFKALKFTKKERRHPDSFIAEPSHYKVHAPADVCDFEDEDEGGEMMDDRTSRWTESVYSRISDESENEEMRDRFARRVEAMLDAERRQTQPYLPPSPRNFHPYANARHEPAEDIHQAVNPYSNITPGRSRF